MGKNISTIIPEPVATLHDGFLRQYLRTGVMTMMNTSLTTFGRHKQGHIFPLMSSVRFMHEGGFAGIMQEMSTPDGFFLFLAQSSLVTGVCSKTAHAFGISPAEVDLKRVFMRDFVPQLAEVV